MPRDAAAVHGAGRPLGAADLNPPPTPHPNQDDVALSGKTRVFFALLRSAAARKERTLLFSQSLHLIDLLEDVLKQRTRPAGDMKWKNGRDIWRYMEMYSEI